MNNHSNYNINPSNQPMGKIARQVDVYHKSNGDNIEIIKSEYTIFENGFLRKEIRFEIKPPLADGRKVESADLIRECHICENAYFYKNTQVCPKCHKDFCYDHDCQGSITEDESTITVCIECEEEDQKSELEKIIEVFWDLNK